jgi:hypothetical protein
MARSAGTRKHQETPPENGEVLLSWDDSYYVECYRLARAGMTNKAIARKLNVGMTTFLKWLQCKPVLKETLEKARSSEQGGKKESFKDFVFGRLPESLQKLWEEIDSLPEEATSEDVHRILKGRGKRCRMQLYLYALAESDFSQTEARKLLGISRRQWRIWSSDPDFGELQFEILQHKKDFLESSLMALVRQGDSAATIFANKTLNRDRGYSERVSVDVNVSKKLSHDVRLRLDEMPVDMKRQLLAHLDEKTEDLKALPSPGEVIEGEIVE